jgi:hypothetical protein
MVVTTVLVAVSIDAFATKTSQASRCYAGHRVVTKIQTEQRANKCRQQATASPRHRAAHADSALIAVARPACLLRTPHARRVRARDSVVSLRAVMLVPTSLSTSLLALPSASAGVLGLGATFLSLKGWAYLVSVID